MTNLEYIKLQADISKAREQASHKLEWLCKLRCHLHHVPNNDTSFTHEVCIRCGTYHKHPIPERRGMDSGGYYYA